MLNKYLPSLSSTTRKKGRGVRKIGVLPNLVVFTLTRKAGQQEGEKKPLTKKVYERGLPRTGELDIRLLEWLYISKVGELIAYQ